MQSIISVENLSKRYRIGAVQANYSTLRESLSAAVRAPFNRQRKGGAGEILWALNEVSFEVAAGEVIGIIGRNGAGKSTLLKILSRITEPTRGRARLAGRVGSLLEVGTGFHMELSGRDNIFLNGAILGMRRNEVRTKFDEIVAFAEVEKFIDTPVKFYSSGMHMRLAFAVAAHMEPEILIIDEVLAVGDTQFQKKCLGIMGDVARQGRTILFVSHNLSAVQNLCSRAIFLERGRLLMDGETEEVIPVYLREANQGLLNQVWDDPDTAPGNDQVRLQSTRLRRSGISDDVELTIRSAFEMDFGYWNLKEGTRLSITIHVYNELGVLVFVSASHRDPHWHGREFPAGLFRTTCAVPGDLLNEGVHRVEVLVARDERQVVFRHEDALVFEIHDAPEMRGGWYGRWPGAVRPNLAWRTEMLDDVNRPG
jgi:lipopolysaccharide transport system ATP-binding protein